IMTKDVRDIAAELAPFKGRIEFNIEGDPRPDLLAMVLEVKPDQCTLVPVMPGEITSQAGWPPTTASGPLPPAVARLKRVGVRVSLFVDAEPESVRWAARMEADRVEFYTEPFARAYEQSAEKGLASFETYCAMAELAHSLGLGVNAGHDLDLENLVLF